MSKVSLCFKIIPNQRYFLSWYYYFTSYNYLSSHFTRVDLSIEEFMFYGVINLAWTVIVHSTSWSFYSHGLSELFGRFVQINFITLTWHQQLSLTSCCGEDVQLGYRVKKDLSWPVVKPVSIVYRVEGVDSLFFKLDIKYNTPPQKITIRQKFHGFHGCISAIWRALG